MSALENLYARWGVLEQHDGTSIVRRDILETLVLLALGRVRYSEQHYLERHPDIKEAVCNGTFSSGWMHFVSIGMLENRALEDSDVDARKYLELNEDLTIVFPDGSDDDLVNHWKNIGWAEGRLR